MDQKELKTVTLCYVAGRSGGHIIPALTLAHQEVADDAQKKILFFTTNTPLDQTIMATSSSIDHHIRLNLGNIPQKKLLWFRFIFDAMRAFYISWRALRRDKPQKIVSLGGYISLPVCLAGRLLNIPVHVIELNVEPGKATQFLTHTATTFSVCFEETKKFFPRLSCQRIDYPVRFSSVEQQITKEQARKALGTIPAYKRVILVLGGSQGSEFINNLIHSWLKPLSLANKQLLYILHQVGSNTDAEAWRIWYENCEIGAQVFEYQHDMAYRYAAADVIVCRSGAGVLFEALFFNKDCITIPLEVSGNSHQVANALAMAERYPHLFTVMRQHQSTAQFASIIGDKLADDTSEPDYITEYRNKFISID